MSSKFISLAAPGVQHLNPYLPGKPVEELERELGISNSIKLASNENPLGPSSEAIKAASRVLSSVNLYPDGGGYKLSHALAEKHQVQSSWITLGNGSNDVLELIARAFLTTQHSAVFSEYSFAVYPIVTQAIGAESFVAKAYSADHALMPYGHDLEAIYQCITDTTRIIFLANPNNPTGTWLDLDSLVSFLKKVPEDVIVVLDEAYYEYMPEEFKPDSDKLLKMFSNLVLTRTFSKLFGLAGLRIGYAVSNPEIADILNRVRQPFNVNLIAQEAALASLHDSQHIQKSFDLNVNGLEQLSMGFKALGLDCIPSIGNFISLDVGGDAAPVYQALLRQGVIVRPLANYNMPEHLRITVGTEQQNIRVLRALKTVLDL